MYAAIFGVFSFNWFGWAQERPRQSWRLYLGIASGIALLIVVAAASLFISKKLNIANSATTGIGVGTALFCFAVLGLLRFLNA